MEMRRAEPADADALASIRRRAILVLAVPAVSKEQAEGWAARAAPDRVARAIREHHVWVPVEEAVIGWAEVDRCRVAALHVSPSHSTTTFEEATCDVAWQTLTAPVRYAKI